MPQNEIMIPTADGDCPVIVTTPDASGAWPAVILYMDAGGIRPALTTMAKRLADAGYLVLLPDLFYRFGRYAPLDPVEVFKTDFRAILGPMLGTTDNARAAADTAALLDYLGERDDVAGARVGVTGYCMGGGMALTVAGRFPDRVVAAASFHGGALATDSPLSPHLLAPAMRGEIYVAGADRDDSYPAAMAEHLATALTSASVRHRCEIYPDALHGWTMPDFPVYEAVAAERAWAELLALFKRNLSAAL